MRQNTNWYQVNPHYFEQIALQQGWISEAGKISFFKLLENSLPYIKELGCSGVWLMPIYERGQLNKKGFGSPYSVKEYQIDSNWGTDDELKSLVQSAKSQGLSFIGEYVPNHMAHDASFINSAPDLIYLDPQGKPFSDHDWNDTVKLNASNPLVAGFTSANLTWFTKNFGFDGCRLDMAHYPLHGATREASFGQGNPEFWNEILSSPALSGKTWIAEVYDDRTQEMSGYKDPFELIKSGMIAYDKKTHDLLARKIRFQPPGLPVQDKLYHELYLQSQVAHLAEINVNEGFVPFLRIPSNHDDCPGVNIYGGAQEFISAFEVLAFLPGDLMLYAGEEFGYKVKPSVTGINYCDQFGNFTESNQIRFLPAEEQKFINSALKQILQIKNSQTALQKGSLLQAKVISQNGVPAYDLLAFARFIPASNNSIEGPDKQLLLVVANLSKYGPKSWGQITHFYPTFDFPTYEFEWTEFLDWVNPDLRTKGYTVNNLKSSEKPALRKFTESFWVGLEALEVQVLKIDIP